jgi:hypothetical protein
LASVSIVPGDGATILGDLIGKLDAVRVTCERCGRNNRYRLESLIAEHGGDVSEPDWLAQLTADCSIKQAQNWGDRCAGRCPDLPKVLRTCYGLQYGRSPRVKQKILVL